MPRIRSDTLSQIISTSGSAQYSAQAFDLPSATLEDSYADYERAIAELPGLGTWPLTFRNSRLKRSGESLFLCSEKDALALPLPEAQATTALPL